MKSSCVITRRSGTARQEFRDYYENHHAPLGMRYFPFRKYLRNHVLEASTDIDFDVIMESYFQDGEDVAAINSGEVRAIMDVDERHFMNPDMIRSTSVEEQLISGPAIGIAPAGTRRLMLLLNPDISADDAQRVTDIRAWGADLAGLPGVGRVSLDTAIQPVEGYGGFPCAAILSLWLNADALPVDLPAAPGTVRLEASVLTEVHETTPEVLAQRFGS